MRVVPKLILVFAAAIGMVSVVLWVRSYWISDAFFYWWQHSTANTTFSFSSERGQIEYFQLGRLPSSNTTIEERTPNRWYRQSQPVQKTSAWTVPDILVRFRRSSATQVAAGELYDYGFQIRVPYWLLVTCASLVSAGTCFLTRNHHVNSEKKCRICGYDLRATPNRCPECGAEVSD